MPAPWLLHRAAIPYAGATLFLKGENSAYIQDKHRPIIEQMFPNMQLQVVANAGHWLHAEQPQVVNDLIADFLAENQCDKELNN